MAELPLTGGCNCGAVRYEVTEPLALASYCQCKRCQRRSGAAASPNAHPAPGINTPFLIYTEGQMEAAFANVRWVPGAAKDPDALKCRD